MEVLPEPHTTFVLGLASPSAAAFWLSAAGLLVGAGMGLYAMLANPGWASRLVRLLPDPARPGGFAEFRATYGGLFAATHLLALAFVAEALRKPDIGANLLALGASAVCAAIWGGTAIGRAISIAADKTGGGFNAGSLVFEVVLGLLIAAPWLLAR